MRLHLDRKAIEAATIEAVLVELAEQGYLDDARFARRFAEDRRALDGWGAERIAQRLLEHGVPREVLEAALGSVEPTTELAAARALLCRRHADDALQDPRARQRALGLLVRRGYDLELAHDAVRAHARELADRPG